MIKLVEVLSLKEEDYKNYKIHFAIGEKNKKEPYDLFLRNEFTEWQSNQTNKNFNRDYVISLIYYDKDTWLFGGVYRINNKDPHPISSGSWDGWHYDMSLLDMQKDLIGRMFIYFKKEFRASYPCLELKPKSGMHLRDMFISSVLGERVTINDFNGFDNVNITFQTLKYIFENEIESWKIALSNVKGIYLIVDTATGKQYVGGAYGEDCIWQRWADYANNGHGDNKELQAILRSYGKEYVSNFKYSILEVCNMNLGNDYIKKRETYWKEVLMTRRFGLNDN